MSKQALAYQTILRLSIKKLDPLCLCLSRKKLKELIQILINWFLILLSMSKSALSYLITWILLKKLRHKCLMLELKFLLDLKHWWKLMQKSLKMLLFNKNTLFITISKDFKICYNTKVTIITTKSHLEWETKALNSKRSQSKRQRWLFEWLNVEYYDLFILIAYMIIW